jgi:hypothetical protein
VIGELRAVGVGAALVSGVVDEDAARAGDPDRQRRRKDRGSATVPADQNAT